MLALTGCQPAISPAPLANTAAPSSTLPASPEAPAQAAASIEVTEPTPTIAAPPITPEYMAALEDGGYTDLVTEPGTLHVVLDETSLVYAPDDNGILANNLRIFSWYTVTFYGADQQYHTGIVLNNVCRMDGENAGRFTSALADGSQVTPNDACPGMPYFQGQNRDLLAALPGDYHILKAFLGTGRDPNKDLVFEDVFPLSESIPQQITIPSIGDVLPITSFTLPDNPQ